MASNLNNEEVFMTDTGNPYSLLEGRGRLSFDPDQGRPTVTLVPGDKKLDKAQDTSLIRPDTLLEDVTIDDIEESAYPLIPPPIFGWKHWKSERTRSQAAHAVKTSKIFYDEFHPAATRDVPKDLLYSRTMAFYLVYQIAGDVPIKVRLADMASLDSVEREETIPVTELLTNSQKAMLSLRNAFMVNFKAIGMRILRAHMPTTPVDVSATVAALKPKVGRLLRSFSKEAYEEKPRDLWASHASWLTAFNQFCESGDRQRFVLYHEIAAAEEITRITASIGKNVVGGSFIDPERGQILRGRYILEPILDMVARGFIKADIDGKTFSLTDSGFQLHQALAPLKDDLRYYAFVDKDRDEVDPARIDEAHAWVIEFFTKARDIADKTESTENAQ